MANGPSGSSEADATCSSVRPAVAALSFMCAWRQPSTSLRGALTGASYDTLAVVPADGPTRPERRAPSPLRTEKIGTSTSDRPRAKVLSWRGRHDVGGIAEVVGSSTIFGQSSSRSSLRKPRGFAKKSAVIRTVSTSGHSALAGPLAVKSYNVASG